MPERVKVIYKITYPNGKIYVGVAGQIRSYNYATNTASSTFHVTGLTGILGMSFSSNGADLFVVTNAEKLYRVDWAHKTLVAGWTFDLTGFKVKDSRAVELINDQFYVLDGKLSCQLYQRSADVFLGVPFNIASYALLTLMLAQVTELAPGEFIHTLGDAHLYLNHLEQATAQLSREPRELPTMRLNPAVRELEGFRFEDFQLESYDPHPPIRAPVAV